MKAILLALCLISLSTAVVWTEDPTGTSDPADWPGVFNMDPSGDMEMGSCVATLIESQHAITAAHCFEGGEWQPF
jgi:hypothetical protein